jgi:cobalt/nickel transport system permease protein
MHIPDGFLTPNICIIGYGITGGLTWAVLKKINRYPQIQEKIPKASLLTAAFFISSLIHIPIPPSSIHLILNGMLGIILGYYSFLAILIGLFFQAVMFNHGGLSTLGINALIMGIPALITYFIFRFGNYLGDKFIAYKLLIRQIFSFLCGSLAVGISAVAFSILMLMFIPAELDTKMETTAIYTSLIIYSIQMIIEGVFTMMVFSFLQKVKPELLEIN